MHSRPDTHQHSYFMKTDIGIHPASTQNKKTHSYSEKNVYIYCMTSMTYYQVNADWLYLACTSRKSEIANLMSNCSQWNLRCNHLTNLQALYQQNDSLIYWAVMCACSFLVDVFADRFSSNEHSTGAIHTGYPFNSQCCAPLSLLILFFIWTSARKSVFSVSANNPISYS